MADRWMVGWMNIGKGILWRCQLTHITEQTEWVLQILLYFLSLMWCLSLVTSSRIRSSSSCTEKMTMWGFKVFVLWSLSCKVSFANSWTKLHHSSHWVRGLRSGQPPRHHQPHTWKRIWAPLLSHQWIWLSWWPPGWTSTWTPSPERAHRTNTWCSAAASVWLGCISVRCRKMKSLLQEVLWPLVLLNNLTSTWIHTVQAG